ncbi:MAG: BamA/TamA family outer membrane protein [candidate division Zixibacteria bacterium]|nr:BamA/TamA family outer membrane protein [candidate division Zixibacteria bacterium]
MRKSNFIIILILFLISYGESSPAELLTGQIAIEGNTFFTTYQIERTLKTRNGQTFNTVILQNDIERLLELYENNGFPYCRITPGDFRMIDKKKIDFKLSIDEGPRVKLKQIYFNGLKYTKPKTLYREMSITSEDYFSQDRIKMSVDRLERLSYIKKIKDVKLESDMEPDFAFLTLEIEENKPNSVQGILGYVPAAGKRSGYFAGNINLVLDNIFGSGRRAETSWGKKDPYSSDLQFSYQESWFLGFPLSLGFSLNQVDYDSTYFKLGLETKASLELWEKVSWGVSASWEKIVPDVAGEAFLANSRKYGGAVEASFDTRDDFNNPRRGIYYKTEVRYSKKSNYATAHFVPEKAIVYETRYSIDLGNFIPTFAYQCVAWQIHLKGMRSDERFIPFVDQFKMGGLNSLRGYREEEFAGSRIAWSNLEYRYLISDNSRIFAFLDYGYFYKLSQDPQTTRLGARLSTKPRAKPLEEGIKISEDKWGYGFGLSIDSKAGIFTIDYAIGEEDKITNGKIHFGIINRF